MLLFDLDGTITDSFTGIARSFRHALAEVGADEPDPEVVRGIAGPPMMDTLHALGLDGDTAEAAMTAYRTRYVNEGWLENAVYPGMAELLDDLSAAGRTIAVATSKNQVTARAILDHFGLSHHFAYIAGASDDSSRRHKSDVIAHALRCVPADPAHAVMIGDRSHDVGGAARFGIPTVLVDWGYALDGEADGARWVVGTVSDLRELLGA
nr:HAD hydrolase-like protein [Williamsia sterculiae]